MFDRQCHPHPGNHHANANVDAKLGVKQLLNLSMRVLLSAVRPEKAQAIFSEEGRGDMVGVRRFGW